MRIARCAEATGESVASCSFHLRILAKYGFIEPGERRGREKPWRVVSRQRTTRPDFDDPASVRAVGTLAELTVLAETERIRAFLADLHRLPADLRDAVGVLKSSIWATPEELRQLSQDVLALVDRFTGRAENHLRGVDDLDDTIARLVAYRDAGADCLYAPWILTSEQIAAVVEAVQAPVNVLAAPAAPPVPELARLGVRRVSTGSLLASAAYGTLLMGARELLSDGTSTYTGRGMKPADRDAAFGA